MYEALEHGITCIDTGYQRPGMAACYLVVDSGEAAIIETGTAHSVERVLGALQRAGMAPEQVRYIIPTHVHLDHAGGAGALLERCPDATLVVHPRGARHLIDPTRLIEGANQVYGADRVAELYGHVRPAPAERVRTAEDGSRWPLGGREFEIRDTPGHARHHFCVWDTAAGGWFPGDTFGIAYRELHCLGNPFLFPTTTPVQFDPDALCSSVELLMSYEPAACYLTHFGAIRATRELADALVEQIRDYVRLSGHRDGSGEETQLLCQALADYTVNRLRQAGCDWEDARLRRFIAPDMELNAQGLVTWARSRP